MKRFISNVWALIFIGLLITVQVHAQSNFNQAAQSNGIWTDLGGKTLPVLSGRYIYPTKFRALSLDFAAMRSLLALAPNEQNVSIRNSNFVLSIPMPEGGMQHFRIVDSPIMEGPLAAQFPEIKTYAGEGLEDPTASIRLDATPQGFHAMILRTGKSTVYIDPYAMGNTQYYMAYLKSDFVTNKVMTCDFEGFAAEGLGPIGGNNLRLFGDCQKRTYRLALAATGEYTSFHGGTVLFAQAAQVTTMNRVNGVYEREMAVRLNIVANNNLLIYTNGGSDPYTNGAPGTMINENQTNCNTVIGTGNYDIGHVFGTNSGGLASLGSVCTNSKARGVTGSSAPIGDPFDIDYVAHEMGHQFGANHTFNSNQGSCNGNQSNTTAMECGSGTTIMAYAGICSAHNVQLNSDDYFHTVSLREIYTFITGSGNSCAVVTALTNSQPTLSPNLANFTIPISTPFVLTATATDPDNDPITYCWEQFDNATNTQPPVSTNTGGPQFRSRPPVLSSSRYFPRLSDLAANTVSQWEVLPSVTRNMRFACYVRDNHPGGGCGDNDSMTVRAVSTAGPFVVTNPNTNLTWQAGSTQNVTWNVANTTAAPVSCANVDIFLSIDGGNSFPITVATNVLNSGTATITVPNNPSTTARIMVKGRGNIFFDISDVNFTITAPLLDYALTSITTNQSVCAPTNAVYTIGVQSIGGYTGAVTLSASGVPSGGTATFSPNPVTPGNNATMTISGTGGIAPGTYTITVNGSATSGLHSTTVTLSVSSGTPAAVSLSTPTTGTTGFSPSGTLTWVSQAGATYDVQISTNSGFTNIVQSATGLSTNSYVISPNLANATQYFWRVRAVTACGTGPYSTAFNFTTSAVTCFNIASTTVPVTISATGTPTVYDSIYVGFAGTITDVNVTNLVGTHTYMSDLRMTLIAPTGQAIILFSQLCTSMDNWDIKFDDAAAPYNTIACPMTAGLTYHPSGNLSTFNGLVPTGWWKLKIEDLANADGGVLTAWTLNICADNACNLTASVATVPVSCNGGNNGTATASPVGGGGPYTYLWSNGQTTSTATGLVAGSYSCTVSDVWGCTSIANATVQQPSQLNATTTSVGTICGLSNGSATASATGGTAGYTYLWSNGSTSATISGVGGGAYTVTVTDTRGCTTTATANVATSSAVTVSLNANNAASCGQSNGSATVAATGGTGAYTYLWSNGNTSATISAVPAGVYTVTVTSGSPNCFAVLPVTIANTGNITATIGQVVQSSCGLSNGQGSAIPSGGTAYTYLWSNGQTSQTATGLAAGTYTVTVTDASTCTATATLVINPSSAVSANIFNFTPTSCGQSNGVASAVATGGNSPYTYLWSDGQTTAVASNLAAGNYTVTVTDQSGCVGTASVSINGSTGPAATISSQTNVDCFGASSGAATAAATGGTAPYTYSWSNGQNTSAATSLNAGVYTCTVTDAAGCNTTTTVTITAPANALAVNATVVDESNSGANDGSINLTPSGGTSPYTYLWSNGATTQNLSGLAGGVYTCTITDANGCTTVVTDTVSTLVGINLANQMGIEIYPNPSQGVFFVAYDLPSADALTISVYNKLGQLIWQQHVDQATSGKMEVALGQVAVGVYSVEIRSNTLIATKKIVVDR